MLLLDCSKHKKETEKLIQTFKKMDGDNNGSLNKEELLQGLTKIMEAKQAQEELNMILGNTVDNNDEVDLDGIELQLCFRILNNILKQEKIGCQRESEENILIS